MHNKKHKEEITDDEILNLHNGVPAADIQIFAIDCSTNSISNAFHEKTINTTLNLSILNSTVDYSKLFNQAIPLTKERCNQIARWISFYSSSSNIAQFNESIMSKNNTNLNNSLCRTTINSMNKDTSMLNASCADLIGPDVTLCLNSFNISDITILD